MKSIAWLGLLVACSSSAPRDGTTTHPARANDAADPPRPEITATMTVLADPGCIAPGTYAMTVDLTTAEVVTAGTTPRDRCIELASHVADHQTLTIEYAAGEPRIEWNGTQQSMVVDACALAVRGTIGEAQIGFRNGKGRGTANLALGEACTARGVRLELVR